MSKIPGIREQDFDTQGMIIKARSSKLEAGRKKLEGRRYTLRRRFRVENEFFPTILRLLHLSTFGNFSKIINA